MVGYSLCSYKELDTTKAHTLWNSFKFTISCYLFFNHFIDVFSLYILLNMIQVCFILTCFLLSRVTEILDQALWYWGVGVMWPHCSLIQYIPF